MTHISRMEKCFCFCSCRFLQCLTKPVWVHNCKKAKVFGEKQEVMKLSRRQEHPAARNNPEPAVRDGVQIAPLHRST